MKARTVHWRAVDLRINDFYFLSPSCFPLSFFTLSHSHCVSHCVSELLLLFGIMPACIIKQSCLNCRIWMGPASNQLTWLLTRIQEQRLHWATLARSSWLDSTASRCPILTVTSAPFITFQHCSHPAPDFFQHSGRDGLNDSCAIERKFSQYFTGLALPLFCTKCLPSEYYSLFTPVFSWLRHSVDVVNGLLCVLWRTVWEWSDIRYLKKKK